MARKDGTWRDHYLDLRDEGEALKLTGSALGRYVSQGMTPQELRDCLADYYRAVDARVRAGGPPPIGRQDR